EDIPTQISTHIPDVSSVPAQPVQPAQPIQNEQPPGTAGSESSGSVSSPSTPVISESELISPPTSAAAEEEPIPIPPPPPHVIEATIPAMSASGTAQTSEVAAQGTAQEGQEQKGQPATATAADSAPTAQEEDQQVTQTPAEQPA